MSGQWRGIRFEETSYGNELDYVDIHGTFDGVQVDSSDVTRQTLAIRNSTIHNCQGNALGVVNSNVFVENCQLTNTLGKAIAAVLSSYKPITSHFDILKELRIGSPKGFRYITITQLLRHKDRIFAFFDDSIRAEKQNPDFTEITIGEYEDLINSSKEDQLMKTETKETPVKGSLIYQPQGAAGEYAKWAINLYHGCSNGCTYCYNRRVV